MISKLIFAPIPLLLGGWMFTSSFSSSTIQQSATPYSTQQQTVEIEMPEPAKSFLRFGGSAIAILGTSSLVFWELATRKNHRNRPQLLLPAGENFIPNTGYFSNNSQPISAIQSDGAKRSPSGDRKHGIPYNQSDEESKPPNNCKAPKQIPNFYQTGGFPLDLPNERIDSVSQLRSQPNSKDKYASVKSLVYENTVGIVGKEKGSGKTSKLGYLIAEHIKLGHLVWMVNPNLVVELNPSMFVMENVPAIEWKKFSEITGNAIALIEEHYILSKWLLTASDYGVPQKRQRAIWVGSKFGEMDAPVGSKISFSVGDAIPKVSVFDAIADLSYIPINSQTDIWELHQKCEYADYLDKIFTSTRLSDHPCNSTSPNLITGCKATAHTTATQQKYTDTKPGEKEPTTWAYRLSADGFSPTLRAGSGNRTAARPIHFEHARVITVREAARLHSFPDWCDFGASKLAAHKAIGNSVPPLLGHAIASQLLMHLEEQQQSSIGGSCFVLTHVLDLQTLEPSADLRIFCSMWQQLGKLNYLAFGLLDAENIKVGGTRSPPRH
jgi:DNA (cytosine-5)-methyltransferase 1